MPNPDARIDANRTDEVAAAGGLWVNPCYRAILERAGWTAPRRLLDPTVGGDMSKPGLMPWRRRASIALTDDAGREVVFFLKQYVAPPRSARRAALRLCPEARTLAGAEWRWMQRLAADSVGCAEPAALAEQLADEVEQASALLIAAAPGISLEQWFARRTEGGDTHRRAVRHALPDLAALIARFHDCGYVHRDLYACHVFIDEDAILDPDATSAGGTDPQQQTREAHDGAWVARSPRPGEYARPCHPAPCDPAPRHPAPCDPAPCHPAPCHPGPRHPGVRPECGCPGVLPAFRLIDLARVFKPRWLRQRWIVKDLAALHYSCPAGLVTRTDRLRWLKLYRRVRRLGPAERRLIRRIETKVARIARHDRSRASRAHAS